ncbi:MAG TPA: hypothetical protein VHX65_17425 [Pirellulales bacterium]|jgi:hypothetical protein|nr:hypothetical protein [Pirellulales bacterium]
MYAFHVTIHARPDDAAPGTAVALGNRSVATLDVPRESLSIPFGISFEEAAQRLEKLPRSCVEPDGSFFYGSRQGMPEWQIDGNLFDRGGRLLFVDLKGTCPAEEFDRMLAALGWPETRLAFQLVREAVLLDEAEFRDWASLGSAER